MGFLRRFLMAVCLLSVFIMIEPTSTNSSLTETNNLHTYTRTSHFLRIHFGVKKWSRLVNINLGLVMRYFLKDVPFVKNLWEHFCHDIGIYPTTRLSHNLCFSFQHFFGLCLSVASMQCIILNGRTVQP